MPMFATCVLEEYGFLRRRRQLGRVRAPRRGAVLGPRALRRLAAVAGVPLPRPGAEGSCCSSRRSRSQADCSAFVDVSDFIDHPLMSVVKSNSNLDAEAYYRNDDLPSFVNVQ